MTTSARRIYGVEDALRLGADGLVATPAPATATSWSSSNGWPSCPRTARPGAWCWWARWCPAASTAGRNFAPWTNHKLAARFGSEFGADLLKTPYCDDFEEVVRSVYTPIVVPGGSKMTAEQLLTMVYNAVQAGAVGCAVGRNVWGADDPAKMTAALAAVIHGGASVADALNLSA